MVLSELLRMIIIFVTFCLNKKKKSHKGSEAKYIQINFHCKVKDFHCYSGGLLGKKRKKERKENGGLEQSCNLTVVT